MAVGEIKSQSRWDYWERGINDEEETEKELSVGVVPEEGGEGRWGHGGGSQ